MKEAEDEFTECDKSKRTLRSCAPKWPKFEEHVKNWIMNNWKKGITVLTK